MIAPDTQLDRVLKALDDGLWHTLAQLSAHTGDSPKSIGSRIRDLRLPIYGGHNISAKQLTNGEWSYKLEKAQVIPAAVAPATVKFINTKTLQPEFVAKAKCKVEPLGKFQRVVALDDQGRIIPHLVTTESQL